MDQRQIVGVGNIYANEALFAAGIDPSKPADRVSDRPTPGCSTRSSGSSPRPSRRRGPPSGTIAPGPANRATSSWSCWSTSARASPAAGCGTRLAGTHDIDARITVFCQRCQG